MLQQEPVALSVAGSDSGCGAGIQADLKTFSAFGVYGLSVLTVITAQSTSSVDRVEALSAELVTAQLNTVAADFNIAAVKSGALGSPEIITALLDFLLERPALPYILDPVMISKHGFRLISEDAMELMRDELIPRSFVVTPNLHEAAELAGMHSISSMDQMYSAAQAILALGCRNVIIKGGHWSKDPTDLLLGEAGELLLSNERVASENTHGTGCTFSAAITACLVRGMQLPEAFRHAKHYITGAIANAQTFGRGFNPVNHFWETRPKFGIVETGSTEPETK